MTLGIEKSKDSARQEVPSKKRQKGIRVSKVEISDNKVKFYIARIDPKKVDCRYGNSSP